MKKITFLFSLCAFLTGVAWFCVHHQFIIFNIPDFQQQNNILEQKVSKKKCKVTVWRQAAFYDEYQMILWPEAVECQLQALITSWLSLLADEKVIMTPLNVQAVFITPAQEVFISFDRTFLPEQWSCFDKLMLIESLLKTIRDADCACSAVRLLLNFQTFADLHLFFDQSLPRAGFLNLPYLVPKREKLSENALILLDPAGSKQQAGRVIDNCYERGLTKQAIGILKNLLQETAFNIGIMPAGENQRIEKINTMHRLQPDVVIHLMCYQEEDDQLPHINIFYYAANPATDFWQTPQKLEFLPLAKAYKKSLMTSYHYAQQLQENLAQKKCNVHCLGAPLQSLFGLAVPAVAIEIGIANKKQLADVMDHISKTIAMLR